VSDEIKVILGAAGVILTTIVGLYIKLKNNATTVRGKEIVQNVKDRLANQKVDQGAYDHLIGKYRDLLEEGKTELRGEIDELRKQVTHYQTEHFECAKKLVAANARLEVLEANAGSLNQRVTQIEGGK